MTTNTTKPQTDNKNQQTSEEENAGSLLSRIGQWFTPKKKKTDLQTVHLEDAPQVQDQPEGTNKDPEKRNKKYQRTGRPPRKRSGPTPARKPQKREITKPSASAAKETVEVNESTSKYTLLINTDEPEECRIALLEDGKVESFQVETVVHTQTKGNIYKGKIVAVEANLQAAFVDIGEEKNGFLPFSDIHPEYYNPEIKPGANWKQLNIKDAISKGQEVLVEVVKEATGNKGANMTTYLSLPGRYLVLMPGSDSAGISRKIDDEAERATLRSMINSVKRPEGIGYIVRTASKDITKTSLSQDMKYLLNLWNEIKQKGQDAPSPSLIYKEQDIISRFLRDYFTPDIDEILVDNEEAYQKVVRFLDLLPAKQKRTKARLHKDSRPIFSHFDVEKQIEQIYQPTVQLPSGGSIVISPTEALVAIDVNSGRTGKDKSFEESIFIANMEAAEELARQLRLRDLGGLIVVDFIDMRNTRHIREVEKQVKTCMKRDKAKVDISRISKFGLLQISRQKMASPVQRGSYRVCEHCQGRGMVRSVETLALVYLRRIQTSASRKRVERIKCRLPLEAAQYLLDNKRDEIQELEKKNNVRISIQGDPDIKPSEEEIRIIKKERPVTKDREQKTEDKTTS
ncbi:MAG: Rne/Rng family ribonuclease [Proteobacteria bacterium]|nr:Rne/Rng family ribonuclease [Pseudomonadota bacterium]MBU1709140.1 Rne/Rng family ribonuclease [Pseudomonadota bacterium]